MKRIVIVSPSPQSKAEDTLLYKSVYKLSLDVFDVILDVVCENTQSIQSLYNQKIEEYSDYDYIIFCHDDISIEDGMLVEKIESYIGDESEYSICGVAGNQKCKLGEKNLWHLMGDRNSMSGAVAHYEQGSETSMFMTNFGAMPRRVVLLDGVFIAVNVKDINEKNIRFDESCPSKFHFYDLDFCLEANKSGLKLTTIPLWIIHKSHGLNDINNKEWTNGNKYFYNKWKTN